MKLYLVSEKTSLENKFCSPYIPDNNPWSDENLFISEYGKVNSLPIQYYVDNKVIPNDFPLCRNILVSKKFMEIIKKLNVDYECFESQMYYAGKNKTNETYNKIWEIYYTFVLPEYHIFNWEKSDYETYYNDELNKKIVTKINKLVLDKNKIDSINFKNNFFHLGEKKTYLICTENMKKAIEEAGLKGISFEEIDIC